MLGFLTLAGWIVTITLGLRMHGATRMPTGVVLPHAALAASGPLVWIAYLFTAQAGLGWLAVGWALLTNGLGDAAAVRRWKKKSDGGHGLVGTYVHRLRTRPIMLVHLIAAGTTTGLAIATVLTA